MLARFAQFIRELICAWWGHDVEEFHADHNLRLFPGAINYIPTPKLIVHLEPPDMPPMWVLDSLPPDKRQHIIEKVMMLRLNPPVLLRSTYCVRCGEAW